MCSIFGAIGDIDHALLARLAANAGDRGRDGGRMDSFFDGQVVLGNWRATPTTEVEVGELQPYDGVVHNGTIANAEELGLLPGEIDSQVLPLVLDRSSLRAFAGSIGSLRGSYAIAATADYGPAVYLACNYKPVYYVTLGMAVYFSSMARHFSGLLPAGIAPVKMSPYSAMALGGFETVRLMPQPPRRAVVVASAGLDSTTVAAMLVRDGYEVCLLHFDYGCQAGSREAELIPRIAAALGASWHVASLDYSAMRGQGGIMTAGAPVAGPVEGAEWAHEWVPARNLLMLSWATAFAEANGYHYLALGNNLEEAGAYPDNEEELTTLFGALLPNAVQNGYGMEVLSPIGHLMKHEIVAAGLAIGAPYELTWSCYHGGDRHCGVCGPCHMRRTAFERNGAVDPVFSGE